MAEGKRRERAGRKWYGGVDELGEKGSTVRGRGR